MPAADMSIRENCPRAAAAHHSDVLKRLCDIVCALIAIVIFFPVYSAIALAVWLEDRHSPIYRQERIGYHGHPFTLYKFRSMLPEAETDGPHLRYENDSNLTRVGRFISTHHLDEFPQLWNVLRGDMSFVGPRPERGIFVRQIIQADPSYTRLYALRPGLFSHATLYNGYTDTLEKMIVRLHMDLDYLEHRSLWLDLRIIAATAFAILSGRKF